MDRATLRQIRTLYEQVVRSDDITQLLPYLPENLTAVTPTGEEVKGPPTSRPTLRWVFHMLEGIERVRMMVDGQVRELITGLNEVRMAILRFFGEQVCLVYQVPSG